MCPLFAMAICYFLGNTDTIVITVYLAGKQDSEPIPKPAAPP